VDAENRGMEARLGSSVDHYFRLLHDLMFEFTFVETASGLGLDGAGPAKLESLLMS
jgi:hypothetical protein